MGRTAFTEPQCLYKGDLYLFYILDSCENLSPNLNQGLIICISKLSYFQTVV